MTSAQSEVITIVSGLPRSGTSMVMQILEAGGMHLLQDNVRIPDEDNPKGYFEFELVKQMKTDVSWLDSAGGKAIKIIYALLPYLPCHFQYNILYLHRDLEEVISSQTTMLTRIGKRGAGASPDTLKSIFQKETDKSMKWLSTQPNIRVLTVHHRDLIENPGKATGEINAFLGGILNVQAMEQVVDPSLYRNKAHQ